MPKTPLRALRVPDELWKAAQAQAKACGESVSEVVRRSLVAYVDPGESVADELPEPVSQAGLPPLFAGTVTLDGSSDSSGNRFLVAQGMVMQRFGMTPDEAERYLVRLAQVSQVDLDDTVRDVLDSRGRTASASTNATEADALR